MKSKFIELLFVQLMSLVLLGSRYEFLRQNPAYLVAAATGFGILVCLILWMIEYSVNNLFNQKESKVVKMFKNVDAWMDILLMFVFIIIAALPASQIYFAIEDGKFPRWGVILGIVVLGAGSLVGVVTSLLSIRQEYFCDDQEEAPFDQEVTGTIKRIGNWPQSPYTVYPAFVMQLFGNDTIYQVTPGSHETAKKIALLKDGDQVRFMFRYLGEYGDFMEVTEIQVNF